ncbi:uncharacterized protein LOC112167431 isoform X2 [Rosa chinensis]|uniref:uncharacterized protein LOC112167431 isoform X2 n=1 Tax=Rosa chinensis TaxID=74649 RepID=UPI000D086D70|nr:uncharacterized protein LOC112167431 isoform X2 [Rosa chinensis]
MQELNWSSDPIRSLQLGLVLKASCFGWSPLRFKGVRWDSIISLNFNIFSQGSEVYARRRFSLKLKGKENDVEENAEISKNVQFRAIQPCPSILSYVEDNLLGHRRLIELKRPGYNTELSAPLDNTPFSISSERVLRKMKVKCWEIVTTYCTHQKLGCCTNIR